MSVVKHWERKRDSVYGFNGLQAKQNSDICQWDFTIIEYYWNVLTKPNCDLINRIKQTHYVDTFFLR